MSNVSTLIPHLCTDVSDPDPCIHTQASALKDLGNKAFAAKDYDKAIELFSQAIAIEPSNHVLYSNRSAARAGKKRYAEALEDANKVRTCLYTFTPLIPLEVTRGPAVREHQSQLVQGLCEEGCCTAWPTKL